MGRAIVNRSWFCAFTDSEMNQWAAITTKVYDNGNRDLEVFHPEGIYRITDIPQGEAEKLENTFQILTD